MRFYAGTPGDAPTPMKSILRVLALALICAPPLFRCPALLFAADPRPAAGEAPSPASPEHPATAASAPTPASADSTPAPPPAADPALVYAPSPLVAAHPDLARARALASSNGGREVWLVELGVGDDAARAARPGALFVGGLEGDDLYGSKILGAWIDRLLQARDAASDADTTLRAMLDSTTLYIIPQLNPDAAAALLAPPHVATARNPRPVDDDHDGLTDEDGPEDLNGDGVITQMRASDGRGDYMPDPAEPRLMMKADPAKGEHGGWRLLTEGVDNDADERWNEDPVGGVNLNRNWPFDYAFFATDAGVHQVSEPATRALADFIVARKNIALVFAYGEPDNLAGPPDAEKGTSLAEKTKSKEGASEDEGARAKPRKPATGVNEDDLPWIKRVGEIYRDAVGLKKSRDAVARPGAFYDWMYYHRGAWAFSARPWFPEMRSALEKPKPKAETEPGDEIATSTLKAADPGADEKSSSTPSIASIKSTPSTPKPKSPDADKKPDAEKKTDERNAEARDYLKWLDANSSWGFVPWTPVRHPDFPGAVAEVGGLAPLAEKFPPSPAAETLMTRHEDFLTTLTLRLPRIAIRPPRVRALGDSFWELRVVIENTGFLPTLPAQGVVNREVEPTRAILDLPDDHIWAGTRVTRVPPIPGSGGFHELRYTLLAPPGSPPVKLRVESALAGSVETLIELKGESR